MDSGVAGGMIFRPGELRNRGSGFVPSESDTDADRHEGKSQREDFPGPPRTPALVHHLKTVLDMLTPRRITALRFCEAPALSSLLMKQHSPPLLKRIEVVFV